MTTHSRRPWHPSARRQRGPVARVVMGLLGFLFLSAFVVIGVIVLVTQREEGGVFIWIWAGLFAGIPALILVAAAIGVVVSLVSPRRGPQRLAAATEDATTGVLPRLPTAPAPGGGVLLVQRGDTPGRARAMVASGVGLTAGAALVGVLALSTVAVPLFMIVLVFVGIGLVRNGLRRAGTARRFLPAEVVVRDWPLAPGRATTLSYRRAARGTAVVREARASVRCVEWVSYQVGTDTRHATEIAWEQELPVRTPAGLTTGLVETWDVAIPADGPASFRAMHNRVEWRLHVQFQRDGGQKVEDDVLLLVDPRPPS